MMIHHVSKNSISGALLVLWASVGSTQGAILAIEDFGSGSTGFPNLDNSTGTGWAAGWTSPSGTGQRSNATSINRTNGYQPSLGDTGFLNTSERTGRNLDTSSTGVFSSYLDSNGNIGQNGKTLYVSVLMGMSVTNSNYYGIEFHRDGVADANRVAQVASEAGTTNNRGMDLRANNVASGAENLFVQSASIADYFVIRFDFGSANQDTITLFRNPTFQSLEGSNNPLASITATDLSFDRISFASFGGVSTTHFFDFDDIRVGETWADVVGAVPEPSCSWLLGLGSMTLLARRRRTTNRPC